MSAGTPPAYQKYSTGYPPDRLDVGEHRRPAVDPVEVVEAGVHSCLTGYHRQVQACGNERIGERAGCGEVVDDNDRHNAHAGELRQHSRAGVALDHGRVPR